MKTTAYKAPTGPRRDHQALLSLVAVMGLVLTGCASGTPRSVPEVAVPVESEVSAAPLATESPEPTGVPPAFPSRLDELTLTDAGALSSGDEEFTASTTSVLVNKRVVEASWGNNRGQFEWQLFSNRDVGPVPIIFEAASDAELLNSTAGIQQDPESDIAGVFGNHIRTKSSGLNPASNTVELHSFGYDGAELQVIALPDLVSSEPGDYDRVQGISVWQNSAAVFGEFGGQGVIVGVSLDSGQQTWKRTCGEDEDTSDGIISGETSVVAYRCGDVTFGISIIDGEEKWQTSGGPEPVSLTIGDGGLDRQLGAPFGTRALVSGWGGNAQGMIDLENGSATWGEGSLLDPIAGLAVYQFAQGELYESDWPDTKEVVSVQDLKTGETVYSIDAGTVRKFGSLNLLGAVDGRLWIWTPDGPDVIDARTGEQDVLAPAKTEGFQHSVNVPIFAGSTWVLFASTNGNGETTPSSLLRDPSGSISAADFPVTQVNGLSQTP